MCISTFRSPFRPPLYPSPPPSKDAAKELRADSQAPCPTLQHTIPFLSALLSEDEDVIPPEDAARALPAILHLTHLPHSNVPPHTHTQGAPFPQGLALPSPAPLDQATIPHSTSHPPPSPPAPQTYLLHPWILHLLPTHADTLLDHNIHHILLTSLLSPGAEAHLASLLPLLHALFSLPLPHTCLEHQSTLPCDPTLPSCLPTLSHLCTQPAHLPPSALTDLVLFALFIMSTWKRERGGADIDRWLPEGGPEWGRLLEGAVLVLGRAEEEEEKESVLQAVREVGGRWGEEVGRVTEALYGRRAGEEVRRRLRGPGTGGQARLLM